MIDTSALVAIVAGEPERDAFHRRITASNVRLVCAVSYQEALTVLYSRRGDGGVDDLLDLLSVDEIKIVPYDYRHAEQALEAFKRYGKGRGGKAQLNFCDCAAYALAASQKAPLLYKGGDFAHTDLLPWQ